MTSRLGLVGTLGHRCHPHRPGKSIVFTRAGHLTELVFSLLIKILELYLDILRGNIFRYQKCNPIKNIL